MSTSSGVSWQKVHQRFHIRIDTDTGRIVFGIQPLDRAGFFQQVLASRNACRTNRKIQFFLDVLQRHFDRIGRNRSQVLIQFLHRLARRVGILDEELLNELVLIRKQHQTLGRQTITSGSSCLLVVSFDTAGHVVMHHESQIGFVDSHSKRVGCDDDRSLPRHKFLLHRTTLVRSEPTVIKRQRTIDVGLQQLDQMLATFSSRSVNDSRSGGFVHKLDQPLIFFVIAGRRFDSKRQIVSRETGHESRWIIKVQNFRDIVLNQFGRRRGQRHCLRIANPLPKLAQSRIIGTEIVTPLADTMGFIDRQQLHFNAADRSHEGIASQTFGRDVNELVLTGPQCRQSRLLLLRRKRTVDEGRWNVDFL